MSRGKLRDGRDSVGRTCGRMKRRLSDNPQDLISRWIAGQISNSPPTCALVRSFLVSVPLNLSSVLFGSSIRVLLMGTPSSRGRSWQPIHQGSRVDASEEDQPARLESSEPSTGAMALSRQSLAAGCWPRRSGSHWAPPCRSQWPARGSLRSPEGVKSFCPCPTIRHIAEVPQEAAEYFHWTSFRIQVSNLALWWSLSNLDCLASDEERNNPS